MAAATELIPFRVFRAQADAAAPAGIDLGTAVRTSPAGGRAPGGMTEEGVVIEVVPPGARVRSARVVYSRSACATRSTVVRYVVQCWDRRVLRWTAELLVVSH